MHVIQTAIAESDANLEVLLKYEDAHDDDVSICESDITEDEGVAKNTLRSPQHATPAQNNSQFVSFNHNLSAGTKRVSMNANREGNDGKVLDSLCKAISQQANVTRVSSEESQGIFTS